jgi:hypothetical protein
MSASQQQWNTWLAALEEMLHDADVACESLFAIHLDLAISQAHKQLGTVRNFPKMDQTSKDDSNS